MSYCVNCGVELDDSAEKCALCGTRVINPNKPNTQEEKITPPFSDDAHIPSNIKKQFVAYVISMVFLIPNLVCFFVNAIFRSGGFWAIYVNVTSLLAWSIFVFPFFTKKLRPYLMWFIDTAAICAYVYFFFAIDYDKKIADWYYTCALPTILSASALILIYMLWTSAKKRHWALKLIVVIADIAVVAFIVGGVLDYFAKINHAADIGMIVFICCAALIVFLTYCYSSKRIRQWLSKRFFV